MNQTSERINKNEKLVLQKTSTKLGKWINKKIQENKIRN